MCVIQDIGGISLQTLLDYPLSYCARPLCAAFPWRPLLSTLGVQRGLLQAGGPGARAGEALVPGLCARLPAPHGHPHLHALRRQRQAGLLGVGAEGRQQRCGQCSGQRVSSNDHPCRPAWRPMLHVIPFSLSIHSPVSLFCLSFSFSLLIFHLKSQSPNKTNTYTNDNVWLNA